MELNKEDILTLDFLLDLLVKQDSHIFCEDLQDFEKYKDAKPDFLRSEFKRLMYFFGFFGCGDPKNDGGVTEWISPNLVSAQFKHSGGFRNAHKKLKKESEDRELEKDLKKLQKENLEYSKTIRDQESRIRNLTEDLKFLNLLKQYWWLILTAIGIGWTLAEILDKI